MIFLMIEIESKSGAGKRDSVRAWVNTMDMKKAIVKADEYLAVKGWKISHVIASEHTERSDYFRSCTGYESFIQAEEHGVAVLMTEEVCTV